MKIAIDFDGTIAEYIPYDSAEGGKGKYGPPVCGVNDALDYLMSSGHEIIIWSSRCHEERSLIIKYLDNHGIEYNWFPNYDMTKDPRKVVADVYVDDKALRFQNQWSEDFCEQIINFLPWWKKSKKRNEQEKDFDANREKAFQDLLENPPPIHDLSGDEYLEKKETVSESMTNAAELFFRKNKDYGDSYKRTGEIMTMIYPNGINLKTAEDFNQYNVLTIMIGKIVRYTNTKGSDVINHESVKDTLTDLGVYAFMLKDLQR